jgi:prevent-host-death family protein
MKRSSVSHTKNQLSALLEQVRQGETIVITDHDRPVAQITAITGSERTTDSLDALQRKGLLRLGGGEHIALSDPVVPKGEGSAVAALLDEREHAR